MDEPHPVEPYCETLAALRRGDVPLPDSENEMAGHVASLDALLEVVPREIETDLEFVRDALQGARDAGGFSALLMFQDLTDSELAGAEGRIADFTVEACGLDLPRLEWQVGPRVDQISACPGWPGTGTVLTNNRFPYLLATSGGNYFRSIFWSVPVIPAPPGMIDVDRGGRVEFSGQYPAARYFGFHPNDLETNNLKTLVDVDLDPDSGSVNPWRQEAGREADRRYTASLVFDEIPDAPERNTSYVGARKQGGFNPVTFVIYRLYDSDLGPLPPNSGGVPLPALTVYDADGEVTEHHPECDPFPPGTELPVDTTRFPVFPVPDYRAVHHAFQINILPNWGMPVDILANADVLYLGTPYGKNLGEVLLWRARLPRTADPEDGTPLSSKNVEMRMFSACTYNFWNGEANSCVQDTELAADADGFYTLMITAPEDRPAGLPEGVNWLSAGPFLDGQLSLRMLLARDQLLVRLKDAIETGVADREIEPYVPRIAACSRRSFDAGGVTGCFAESREERSIEVDASLGSRSLESVGSAAGLTPPGIDEYRG